MQVSSVSNSQNFNGRVIVLDKISANQKYLLNLHKKALECMIADKPYDLFVKQSKSRKTITLSADKDCKSGFMVYKGKQNFEEVAELVILDKDLKLKNAQNEIAKREQQDRKLMQESILFWKNYLQDNYLL